MASSVTLSGRLRAWWRMFALLCALAWYLGRLILLSSVHGATEKRGFLFRRKFAKAAMSILGVRLRLSGQPSSTPALYVSNHRSMLDPIIQLRYLDAYIVSKSEVEKYPMIGRGARETGVVFVKRESPQSRVASRDAIRRLLASGKSVLIYPEGTTSDEATTREFRAGSFEIASELGVPVIPVMIQYFNPAHHWADGPMLPFFLRKFSQKRINAALSIGVPVLGSNPTMLMTVTRAWIGEEIIRVGQNFDAEINAA